MCLIHYDSYSHSLCKGSDSTLCCFFLLWLMVNFLKHVFNKLNSLKLYLCWFFKTCVRSSVIQWTSSFSNICEYVRNADFQALQHLHQNLWGWAQRIYFNRILLCILKWLLCILKFEALRSTNLKYSSREAFHFFSSGTSKHHQPKIIFFF